MFDKIKAQLSQTVPFAKHVGVEVLTVARGNATARLPERPEVKNHVGTQHAAALFALGETASGAAMAGALAPIILDVRPVASEARITFMRPAKGDIEARAKINDDADTLVERIQADGKTRFNVEVAFHDMAGVQVGALTVEWHVSKKAA